MTDKKRQIERLFKLHYRAMYRLACILLHDGDESKDIVHDVFAQLLTNDALLNEATALAFLLSCVRNRCLNEIRHRKTHEQVKQRLLLDEELESTGPEELEAENNALHLGIAELFPPICREIIVLHFAEGLTFREIAERMQVSETTIYKHLRSALNQLRLTLKQHEQ
ncbi:MAG: sigma-70 family RNA polymerase sigma factor [Muribaculaceae bacterium]|nr:sigma-70 family RNA polymerase sigma factor [Muribaculaceae bacterium]